MFVGAFSGMLSAGGIQRMSGQMAGILAELARERGEEFHLLSLPDAAGEHEVEVAGERFTVRGFADDRLRFAAAVLRLGLGAHTVLLGHPGFAPIGLALRVLRPRLRIWVAVYGMEVWVPLGALDRLGLRSAYGILSISRYTAERLTALNGVPRERIHVLPCSLPPGVDDALPRPARSEGRGHTLLSVSRLTRHEDKGIDHMIRAFPRVLARFPDAVYWIVGDGDGRPQLERLAEETGVAGRVRFLGAVPDAELVERYRAADVFVLPSLQEGFGLVYVEAMLQGRPVIAGDHGGAPEVVEEGVTGFLVKFGDVDLLAARAVELLGDPALRGRMGAAGRRRVQERFMPHRYRDGFRAILAPDSPPPSSPRPIEPGTRGPRHKRWDSPRPAAPGRPRAPGGLASGSSSPRRTSGR